MKQSITATLVVRNEEKMIRGCLESIKDAVDEIVVVHDGPCEDRTLEIAGEYTDKVFIYPLQGNPELIRPYSFRCANGNWILVIDADERLSPGLQKQLGELVKNTEIDAYSFLWPYCNEIGPIKQLVRRKKTLFRKKSLYHLGMPHVGPETRGRVYHSDFNFEHHWSQIQMKRFIRTIVAKNIVRAKIAANLLSGDIRQIPAFQTVLWDSGLKHHQKFRILKEHPFIALPSIPLYSFLHHFVVKKYYRDGWLGFGGSIELSSYYFFIALFRIKESAGKIPGLRQKAL